jgi:hypothetical protein
MGERNSFILLYKYNDIFKDLNEKQAGVLIKAIFEYQIEGKLAHFSDLELRMAFKFIKKDMDFNNNQYEEKCLKNKANGRKGGRPLENRTVIKETERLFEKPKKPDNDVDVDNDVDNDNEKEKNVCMSKLVDLQLRDRDCATAQPTPTHIAARGFGGERDFRGNGKGNGNRPPTAAVAVAGNATASSPIAKAQINPYDTAQKKALSPAAELYEAFKTLYQAQTHLPYNARKEDLASMEILVSTHGDRAVENRIRILHAGCKDALFWFTKKGFSDFTVDYLVLHWNNLVPFESEEEKRRKKMDKLLGIGENR